MKKILLGISLLFPLQLLAADDSVFSWGDWAQGIKPAAGPAVILPAPVQQPNVASLTRSIQVAQEEQVSTVQAIAAAQAAADAAAAQAAAEAAAQAIADAQAAAAAELAAIEQAAAANNSELISGTGVASTSTIDVNAAPSL